MTFPYEGSPTEPTTDDFTGYDESATAEVEDNDLDDSTADDEHEDEAAAGKKSSRRKPARPTRLTAAQVRRVLSQADVIDQQEPAVRELLAATLSTNTSTEDLVVATLSASKAPTEVIDDLLAIAGESDPFKSVVLAAALVGDRDNARRTWAILASLGKVSGSIPAKEVLAGAAVASAAKDLDLDDLAGLSLVTDLLG